MKFLFDLETYLPILNGLLGDKFAQKKDSWTIQMSFRMDGSDIPVAKLPVNRKAKKTLVLVHGLMADERIWKHFQELEKDFSVLYVRYNTGLHISENGQALAQLLNELDDWVGVKELYLAGHSMGGLVVRSACHYGQESRHRWVKKIPAIFLIAVPNAGAALEKLGHVTATVLNRIARWHTGTIGNIIEQRSNGIKDLRLGSMLEEDWKSGPATSRSAVEPVPGIAYHILVGTLSKDEKSLMAKYFGDGLVTQNSAVATTLLKVSYVKVFAGTGHNAILGHADVRRYVRNVIQAG